MGKTMIVVTQANAGVRDPQARFAGAGNVVNEICEFELQLKYLSDVRLTIYIHRERLNSKAKNVELY